MCQVAPLEYLRHVTMDIGGNCGGSGGSGPGGGTATDGIGSDPTTGSQLGVSVLIERFNEVSLYNLSVLLIFQNDETFTSLLVMAFCQKFCIFGAAGVPYINVISLSLPLKCSLYLLYRKQENSQPVMSSQN